MNIQLGFRYPRMARRYVLSCTHCSDGDSPLTPVEQMRARYLGLAERRGLVVPVAMDSGVPCGFSELVHGEYAPRQFFAPHALVMHCITSSRRGAGRALLNWALQYVEDHSFGSLVVEAYDHPDNFWFMPASFFRHYGFEQVASRGIGRLLWKPAGPQAVPPSYMPVQYRFNPDPARVTVEVYYCPLCTQDEVLTAKSVCADYADKVILRCVSAGDRRMLERYGINREVIVDGQARGGGDMVTEAELRVMIESAIARRRVSGPPDKPHINLDKVNQLF